MPNGILAGNDVLSAMITPAVLISASGMLSLATTNRMGRVVDRIRDLSELSELLTGDVPARNADEKRTLITGLLNVYALLFGITGGIFAELAYGQPLGGFFATLFNNASVTDLWGSVLKTTLFGAIIAIVCSYKGMNASGGAQGVGTAVNEAVVIAFMGVFAFNYVFTQTLLATHP